MNDSVCRRAREIAPKYHSTTALTAAVNDELGLELTDSVLRDRYRRWSAKSGAPALKSLLRSGPSDFVDEPTVEFPVFGTEPFKLPAEVTRKKTPPPQERVVPWDWSEAPPRRMIIESDNHYCHEDKAFQAAKFEFAARRGCDALFNLGDQHDFTNLSRWDKDPQYANTLWDDVRASNERHWDTAVQIFRRIEFIEGNHDWRIYKAIMANHALFGLPGLVDWHALGIPKQVKVHTYGTHRQIGHVWGEHGDQVRGQNPTHYAMQHRGGRVVTFGHSHKPGSYIRVARDHDGQMQRREVYNLGHGQDESTCDLWAGTVKGWSHSFLYVEHYQTEYGWDVNCYPIHVDRGAFVYDGVVYKG